MKPATPSKEQRAKDDDPRSEHLTPAPGLASRHSEADPRIQSFATFSWLVLLYNFAAVAWGVFVRATNSGDGCGSHWPLCDGKIIPPLESTKQIVEFSHRLSTGLILPMVAVMVYLAVKRFPKGSQVRTAVYFALFFTCLEALIGAALVKFGWVASNTSVGRAWVMSFHVVSTFLLMSSIGYAAFAATTGQQIRVKGQSGVAAMLGLGFIGIIVLGVSGAISALGHTLYPSKNVLEAASAPGSSWMVKLQPMHPYLSIAVGLYLLLIAGLIIHLRPSKNVRNAALVMVGIYGLQLLIGLFNIQLKAPVWMQMLHLVMADVVFVSLLLMSSYALTAGARHREDEPVTDASEPSPTGKALIKAYIALTKPRVISLLLFTTLTAMFASQGGWPGGWLLFWVAIGGYMSAGAANAINMVVDRDIDVTMKRTAKRPTVTQAIPSNHALLFGLTLTVGSFLILWGAANLLAAMLSLAGLVFYVVIYTLLLKRRTWHNIVIGGAAGAFPPLVGWAAVSNDLTPLAWYLFAIIFVWTPVHFWALALMIKDDYKSAGVPMLPCVLGERATAIQIAVYTVLTFIVTLMPVLGRHVGALYVVTAVLLNFVLLVRAIELFRKTERPQALSLYKFSMLYLALLFLMLAIDQRWLHAIA